MRARRGFLVVTAIAALASACTTSGQATPATSSKPSAKTATTTSSTPKKRTLDPNHVTAKDALGDFATVDPCSTIALTDLPAKYNKDGAAFEATPANVDSCSLGLALSETSFIVFDWGLLEGRRTLTEREHPGHRQNLGHGLTLVRSNDKAGDCRQYLVFADDIAMEVHTYPAQGKLTGLCDAGKAMAELIVKSLLAKEPARRVVRDTSLSHQDACRMLTPDIVDLLPGAAGAKPDRDYPAHHYCHYEGPHLESIALVFGTGDGDDDPPDGATLVKIAGKPTFQYKDSGDDFSGCQLTTVNTVGGRTRDHTETLELIVFLDGRSDVCPKAVKLADKLWRKLPAA